MLNVPVIVANWKMNKTVCEAINFMEGLSPYLPCKDFSFWVAAPFTAVWPLSQWAQKNLDPGLLVGVQNIFYRSEGPFTGEISARQAAEAGAQFVILGHSERRMFGGEGEMELQGKLLQAFKNNLTPILCVGESMKTYKEGQSVKSITSKLKQILSGVPKEFLERVMIAYEPVWAVGATERAESGHIQNIFCSIRSVLLELSSSEMTSKSVSLLYGGSVSPQGFSELLSLEGMGGVLVGSKALSWGGVAELFKAGVCV